MKITILGSGGSGKSTLARRLSSMTNIPTYHMDQLFWKPNWVPSNEDELRHNLLSVVALEDWIIDGNYRRTIELRAPASDIIIYLKRSTVGNLYRVLKRYFMYRGKSRPDMPNECEEKIDFEFIMWVLLFNKRHREFLEGLQETYKDKLIILTSKVEIDDWVNQFVKGVERSAKSN